MAEKRKIHELETKVRLLEQWVTKIQKTMDARFVGNTVCEPGGGATLKDGYLFFKGTVFPGHNIDEYKYKVYQRDRQRTKHNIKLFLSRNLITKDVLQKIAQYC